MPRLDPAAQRRLDSSLALAERGATAGERAAGKAAAERIVAAAGLTLAEAGLRSSTARPANPKPSWTPPPGWTPPAGWPGRSRSRAKPRKPKPPTVAERLREKAEEAAVPRERAAAADRRFWKDHADQFAWEAEQREAQAECERAWAESRATAA